MVAAYLWRYPIPSFLSSQDFTQQARLRQKGAPLARSNTFYRITLKNWEKYNKKRKKGYQCVLISTGFFSDAKVMTLTPGGKLLLLTCILHAADTNQGWCELNTDLIQTCTGLRAKMIPTYLDRLKELQILSYASITPLIEKEKKKEKKIEKKGEKQQQVSATPAAPPAVLTLPPPPPEEPKTTADIIALYCKCYKSKYGHSPEIGSGKRPGIFKRLLKEHGFEKCQRLIQGYFSLPDVSLVKAAYPVEWIENRINEITRFLETGQVVFREQMREADKEASLEVKYQAQQLELDTRLEQIFSPTNTVAVAK